jgi:hypothetical protein
VGNGDQSKTTHERRAQGRSRGTIKIAIQTERERRDDDALRLHTAKFTDGLGDMTGDHDIPQQARRTIATAIVFV